MIFTTIGIGLLLVVFYLAFEMLTHPVPGLKQALVQTSTAPGGSVNSVASVGSSVISFLLKLAVLFVMTLAGSHVAARGIQLYHGGSHPAVGSTTNLPKRSRIKAPIDDDQASAVITSGRTPGSTGGEATVVPAEASPAIEST